MANNGDPETSFKNPKRVELLIKNINKKIKSLEEKIERKKESFAEVESEQKKEKLENEQKDLKARVTFLNGTLADIKNLSEDKTHTYNLKHDKSENHSVEKDDDGIINIEGHNDALFIHEIKHVALSLASEKGLVFSKKNNKLTANYHAGFRDELNAYMAQYSYDPSTLPKVEGHPIHKIGDINLQYLGGITNENGTPTYPELAKLAKEEATEKDKIKKAAKVKAKAEKKAAKAKK